MSIAHQWPWPPQPKLKRYLLEHDCDPSAIAAQVGISTTTLAGLMSGRVRPTQRIRELIAATLNQPPEVLFDHIDDLTHDEEAEAESWRDLEMDDETAGKIRRLLSPRKWGRPSS